MGGGQGQTFGVGSRDGGRGGVLGVGDGGLGGGKGRGGCGGVGGGGGEGFGVGGPSCFLNRVFRRQAGPQMGPRAENCLA